MTCERATLACPGDLARVAAPEEPFSCCVVLTREASERYETRAIRVTPSGATVIGSCIASRSDDGYALRADELLQETVQSSGRFGKMIP